MGHTYLDRITRIGHTYLGRIIRGETPIEDQPEQIISSGSTGGNTY
jgi:hypothetical protein